MLRQTGSACAVVACEGPKEAARANTIASEEPCAIGHMRGNRRLMAPILGEESMRRRGVRRNGKMLVGPILRQAMSACTDAACKEQQEAAGATPMESEGRVRQRGMRRAARGLQGRCYGERRRAQKPSWHADVHKFTFFIPSCTCRLFVYWFDNVTSWRAGSACANEASGKQQELLGIYTCKRRAHAPSMHAKGSIRQRHR